MSDRIKPWMREAARSIPGYVEESVKSIAHAYSPEASRIEKALANLAQKWVERSGRYSKSNPDLSRTYELLATELDALRRELFGEKG